MTHHIPFFPNFAQFSCIYVSLAEAGRVGNKHIKKRRLLDVLSLALQNFANFEL